ncbi:MAG: DUF2849 domain-containing protein [Hyphomicrobiaceae bacterium]
MTERCGHIVSANDLFEGNVVYMKACGAWTKSLEEAAVAADKEAAKELLRIAHRQVDRVVGPYLIAVLNSERAIEPSHIREKLRDTGPSIVPIQSSTTSHKEREGNHVSL